MERKRSAAAAITGLAILLAVPGALAEAPATSALPVVDLAAETGRQVVADREAGQYLGHPTTVLLEDGKTILCVYPKGHGKGAIPGEPPYVVSVRFTFAERDARRGSPPGREP